VRVLGRRLALIAGLTVGDYLLWNWSLDKNHGALALLSGLTLPPLTIALVWVLVLLVARLVARYPSWHAERLANQPRGAARGRSRYAASRRREPVTGARRREDPTTAARRGGASSDKIAA
jgi:hypothetical protein